MPKEKRDKIFVWPSWIAKLVAGEEQCYWKYWLKAHYKVDKNPSDFNLAKWTVEHTKLVRQRRDALERLGFKVFIEDQNSFKLNIQLQSKEERVDPQSACVATISGKPDIVAIGQEEDLNDVMQNVYLVEDGKTGNPKTSDHIQVLFYMMLLPKTIEKYKDKIFDGCIVYKQGIRNVDIPSEAAQDESLKKYIWDTIKQIAGNETDCRKVPSRNECKKCDIRKEDCSEKIE